MKDSQDSYHFAPLIAIMLGASLFISLFVAPFTGLGGAIILFLGLSVTGLTVAFLVNYFQKGTSSLMGGLFLGSKRKDNKAILKGMYHQANGLKMTGQYALAEKIYRQIIEEYPQEIEAPFHLGSLLWVKMDRSKEALKMFRTLEQKIRLEKLPFQYREALKKNITDLSSELASGK